MYRCSYCASANTQTLADRFQCLDCGHLSNMDETEASTGLVWTSEVPVGTENTARATAWAVHDQTEEPETPKKSRKKAKT